MTRAPANAPAWAIGSKVMVPATTSTVARSSPISSEDVTGLVGRTTGAVMRWSSEHAAVREAATTTVITLAARFIRAFLLAATRIGGSLPRVFAAITQRGRIVKFS